MNLLPEQKLHRYWLDIGCLKHCCALIAAMPYICWLLRSMCMLCSRRLSIAQGTILFTTWLLRTCCKYIRGFDQGLLCMEMMHHRDSLKAIAVGQHCPSSALYLAFNCRAVKSRVRLIEAVTLVHGRHRCISYVLVLLPRSPQCSNMFFRICISTRPSQHKALTVKCCYLSGNANLRWNTVNL